jgi:predicted enzyme related to lactoylglutathione lyase
MARPVQVAIDCRDPDRLAEFWAAVLGYEVRQPPNGHDSWAAYSAAVAVMPEEAWSMIVDPAGTGPSVLFHAVPEAKVCKNRVHLDVFLAKGEPVEKRRPLVAPEVERLVALGARHVRTDDDGSDYYAVMQDPEGNEFCVG